MPLLRACWLETCLHYLLLETDLCAHICVLLYINGKLLLSLEWHTHWLNSNSQYFFPDLSLLGSCNVENGREQCPNFEPSSVNKAKQFSATIFVVSQSTCPIPTGRCCYGDQRTEIGTHIVYTINGNTSSEEKITSCNDPTFKLKESSPENCTF